MDVFYLYLCKKPEKGIIESTEWGVLKYYEVKQFLEKFVLAEIEQKSIPTVDIVSTFGRNFKKPKT